MSKSNKLVPNNGYDDKYIATLNLANAILSAIGKDPIDDLVKFTNLYRMDLIKNVVRTAWDNMENIMFQYFGPLMKKSNKLSPNYVMMTLHLIMRDLGYDFNVIKNPNKIIQ